MDVGSILACRIWGSLGHSWAWSLSLIGTPCRKVSRHHGRIGAGEAKPELAPGIFLVVAAGDRGSHGDDDPRKASDLDLSNRFSGRMGR